MPGELTEFRLEGLASCCLLCVAENELPAEGLHEYVQLSHCLAAELLDSGPCAFHYNEPVSKSL